jgi:hypothetical protein
MNLWQCGILRNPHQQRDIMCFYWVRVPFLLTSIILLAYQKIKAIQTGLLLKQTQTYENKFHLFNIQQNAP